MTDKVLVAKVVYEATRARDNGHSTQGGRPDWFHTPDGARAKAVALVESGKSDDPLAQAIMDCLLVPEPKPEKPKAAPKKKAPAKRKAKK